jgi:hypothetical protein
LLQKRADGVAEGEGPEFKSQYCKKKGVCAYKRLQSKHQNTDNKFISSNKQVIFIIRKKEQSLRRERRGVRWAEQAELTYRGTRPGGGAQA